MTKLYLYMTFITITLRLLKLHSQKNAKNKSKKKEEKLQQSISHHTKKKIKHGFNLSTLQQKNPSQNIVPYDFRLSYKN